MISPPLWSLQMNLNKTAKTFFDWWKLSLTNYVMNISRRTYVAQRNEGCDGRTRTRRETSPGQCRDARPLLAAQTPGRDALGSTVRAMRAEWRTSRKGRPRGRAGETQRDGRDSTGGRRPADASGCAAASRAARWPGTRKSRGSRARRSRGTRMAARTPGNNADDGRGSTTTGALRRRRSAVSQAARRRAARLPRERRTSSGRRPRGRAAASWAAYVSSLRRRTARPRRAAQRPVLNVRCRAAGATARLGRCEDGGAAVRAARWPVAAGAARGWLAKRAAAQLRRRHSRSRTHRRAAGAGQWGHCLGLALPGPPIEQQRLSYGDGEDLSALRGARPITAELDSGVIQ